MSGIQQEAAPLTPKNRRVYMNSKLQIEREVIDEVRSRASFDQLPPAVLDTPQPKGKKVAFIFLAMKNLMWPEVWREFFQVADKDLYNIYVHRAKPEFRNGTSAEPLPLQEFGSQELDWVKTGWCALFGVEVSSLEVALRDEGNEQFVFISDSTVALKSFNYVYKNLMAEDQVAKSKFCMATPAYFDKMWKETIYQEARRGCVFKDWLHHENPRTLKHHQWIVLARHHAKAVVKYAEEGLQVYEQSWKHSATNVSEMGEGCSDEGAPITTLLEGFRMEGRSTGVARKDLELMGVESQCTTFVWWRNCFAGTELELPETTPLQLMRNKSSAEELTKLWSSIEWKGMMPETITYDLLSSPLKRKLNGFPHEFEDISLDYLGKLVSQGFMFARKFTRFDAEGNEVFMVTGKEPQPSMKLQESLPALWKEVDEPAAAAKAWSHLEYDGRPQNSSARSAMSLHLSLMLLLSMLRAL